MLLRLQPSLDIMNPKMVPKNTMNANLLGFNLIPNYLHFRKHFFSFSRWVDMSLKIVKLLRKIFTNTSIYSRKCLLINGQSIFDIKWHHNPRKSPLIYYKGDFVLVLWCDLYLMISWKLVQKGINLMSNNYVDNLIRKRQRIRILLCCYIEFCKINTNPQLPIFLKNNQYWRQPSCFLN